MKLVFTDLDGSKYYQDAAGDILNARGELVSITQEDNIRSLLDTKKRANAVRMGWRTRRNNAIAPSQADDTLAWRAFDDEVTP